MMSEKMKDNINMGIFLILIILAMTFAIIGNHYMFKNDKLWAAYTLWASLFGYIGYMRSDFLLNQAKSESKANGDKNEEN